MHLAFAEFRAAHVDADVHLKLGIHAGPCYAVTANKIIDYFGQTVNVAARLQGQAEAGELVVAEELAERALAEGWLTHARISERFGVKLKGIDDEMRAARLVCAGEAARAA